MTDGRGWHGDPDQHRDAALRSTEKNYQTHWRYTGRALGELVSGDVEGVFASVVELLRAVWHLTLAVVHLAVFLFWLPVSLVAPVVRFVWEQMTGWMENILEWRTKGTWTDFVPPSVESTIRWFLDVLPEALGLRGTAYDQVTANIVLAAATLITTLVTGGATAFFFAIWWLLGVYALFFRETPKGNRLHKEVMGKVTSALPFTVRGEAE